MLRVLSLRNRTFMKYTIIGVYTCAHIEQHERLALQKRIIKCVYFAVSSKHSHNLFFLLGIQATSAIQVVTIYRAIHSYGRYDAIV